MSNISDLSQWTGMKGSEVLSAAGERCSLLASGNEACFVYEAAEDWRGCDVIALDIHSADNSLVELTITVHPLKTGRPEYIESTSATVLLSGNGWRKIEIGRDQFDHLQAAAAFWRFVSKVTLSVRSSHGSGAEAELLVGGIRLKKRGQIDLCSDRLSLTANAGDEVVYKLTVHNLTDEHQPVTLGVERYGFESMVIELEPQSLLLGPGETAEAGLRVRVHEGIAPGGYERQIIYAIPNGDANFVKKQTFMTGRTLPRPYMIHTETEWTEVRRKAETLDWARTELADYVRIAEEWEVPGSLGAGKPYVFELKERHNLYAAAVAWKLTGRSDLLDKAVLLLRRFADPLTGYPSTAAPIFKIFSSRTEAAASPTAVKVCAGELIHEGEFMLTLASCYDLLHNEGVWSHEDHQRMEAAFHLFMEKVDFAITDGDTNNIPSGAMAGALMCSLAIQDWHGINRFIEGPGGFRGAVRTGIMDDGWYFEGAPNYVVLFADMMTLVIKACLPLGINLRDEYAAPSYLRNVMLSPWSFQRDEPFLGMSFEKFGPVNRNYRSVKDVWDAMLPFIDYRGILFAANDSTEKDMAKWYDLAYYVWRDPKYASVIRGGSGRDLLYGAANLPDRPAAEEAALSAVSTYSDNVGFCVLRSQTRNRQPSEQIQAVLKYGTHGGYHGHFDRASLVSLMRYGRNAYSPLGAWYGYFPFMFKMWVQTSMAHNMVVVDGKMQEPKETRRLLFHSGPMLQACAVETLARWCDPPYGGQTPYPESFPEERIWMEGRDLPIPDHPRRQGETGEFTEPVLQRRLLLVTDDYTVEVDYLRGESAHVYDCLHHFQGFKELEGDTETPVRHSAQMSTDPYSAAQFITDCQWQTCDGPAVARFSHQYDQEGDNQGGRHMMFNENGRMNVDAHSVWPKQREIMTGWYPEEGGVSKRVSYAIYGDGRLLDEGRFGAWILGTRAVDVPLAGVNYLKLQVSVQEPKQKTIFWGDAYLLTKVGSRIPLTELTGSYENVDNGCGPGIDYGGGPVHMAGKLYADAIPFEPEDSSMPAAISICLDGLDAVSFHGVIGGDYPVGHDPARRKTVSIRSEGREALFINVLEAYEGKGMIEHVSAVSSNELTVNLRDGRTQRITLFNMENNGMDLAVELCEFINGAEVRRERASAKAD